MRVSAFVSLVFCHLFSMSSSAAIVDFEDIELPNDSDIRVVLDGNGDVMLRGFFESGGVRLLNENQSWGWSLGFLVSNRTDTKTPGFDPTVGDFGAVVNDSSAFAGSGSGEGEDNYAVGFGYLDGLDPFSLEQLELLPFLELPQGQDVVAAQFTNTTWAGLAMQNGDGFAKPFGGETGDDADFFRLSVYGSADGIPLSTSVELFLADYRFEDNSQDFILDDWQRVDLTPLAAADRLYFNLDSSDVGDFGMNTPSFFAIDGIELQDEVIDDVFGDISGDGVLDQMDADELCSAILNVTELSANDLDGDGLVTLSDIQLLLDVAAVLPGDINFDGAVDFTDFLAVSKSFGKDANWSSGDFDCNGVVGFGDFLQLSDNFGNSVFAHSMQVPEPESSALMLVASCVLFAFYRSRFANGWKAGHTATWLSTTARNIKTRQ